METEVKLTKLASCAGCGAKVGAGTLVSMLEGFRTHLDPRLLVGYDKSDDACVYQLDASTALVQTTDFFPPIVDDPFLYGQIAAANALSDVYAMGGEPRLALNILCLPEQMGEDDLLIITADHGSNALRTPKIPDHCLFILRACLFQVVLVICQSIRLLLIWNILQKIFQFSHKFLFPHTLASSKIRDIFRE